MPPLSQTIPQSETGRVVLVVESDALARRALVALLKGRGYQPWAVEKGQSALNLMNGGVRPELVVVDMALSEPERAELMKRLEAGAPGVPVVWIGDECDTPAGIAATPSPARHLRKPFRFNQLMGLIAQGES